MKKLLSLFLTILFLQSAFCFVLLPTKVSARNTAARSFQQEILTNQSVIDMVGSKFSEELIIAKIKSSRNSFDTSAAALQQLKKVGVSDAVILAMVQKASGMEMTTSGATATLTIPDGTELKIMTTEDISGQKVVEGDPLTFKVAEDVKVSTTVVIAKDVIVKGTVSSAKKKGFMGKGGELSVRIESTQTVDGQKVKLRASKSGAGGDNMGSTVALTVLFGPLGLLRKGKEAKIKAGTILTAYTDEAKNVTAAN
ncbi:MAG: hypothetical protein AVDCRST_MAG74-3070 [uncultured Pyrinomonadaceae bacterium]|uniref:Uncharacterized protein n=1 Tax=uncultured Pyrinomonadaceae bacterium TaxID=2283094 RepID=A0A6J4PP99_9BACT|nr:MAG: hypothetical protein AVDCRST_MAG74-3070 [uncultured Pyrinomonadaceae bacterium]